MIHGILPPIGTYPRGKLQTSRLWTQGGGNHIGLRSKSTLICRHKTRTNALLSHIYGRKGIWVGKHGDTLGIG
jgi:hypothetical protein